MTLRTVARRYAGALFEVAEKQRTLDHVHDDLQTLQRLLTEHEELKTLVESALVPVDRKRAVAEALVRGAQGMSAEVGRLLTMLAERDRLHLLDEIAGIFEERLLEHRHVVRAELVTASGLGEPARAAISRALSAATNGEVRLTERVDPSLIGGITATVGSVVFDGSVATRLERLRQRLHQQ